MLCRDEKGSLCLQDLALKASETYYSIIQHVSCPSYASGQQALLNSDGSNSNDWGVEGPMPKLHLQLP